MSTTTRRPVPRQMIRITDAIRATIAQRGLTAYSLAKASGLSVSVIDRFIRGERGLSGASLDAMAEVLGMRLVATGDGLKGKPKRSARQSE